MGLREIYRFHHTFEIRLNQKMSYVITPNYYEHVDTRFVNSMKRVFSLLEFGSKI